MYVYGVSAGKPKGKRSLEESNYGSEDNIKTELGEMF
jgi:hypothetical protein